jgi:HAD superfamily hydrolase (TIGR01509 family)
MRILVDTEPHRSLRAGVLLDIDGTLVDTNHLHVIAWARAFARRGHEVAMHRIHRRVGMGGDQLVAELIGEDDPAVAEAWAEEFHHLWPEVRVLPGARDLVVALHELDLAVVLASSSPAGDVASFRRLLDVDDALAGATSAGDAEASKPDPGIFQAAMDRFGLDPAATVAIGDAVWDARAASRAGIGFLGVESGGTDRHVLEREGARLVVEDAAGLVELVRSGGRDVLGLT